MNLLSDLPVNSLYEHQFINMKMDQNCIQCVIVGDGMVGKSHLAKSFSGHPLQDNYVATVFDNYAGKKTS